MSEPAAPTTPVAPVNPVAAAASLYPADGGAAAAAGQDTQAGAETTAGTDTVAGTDSVADTGADSVAGEAGADSVAGTEGADSISAPEYNFKLPENFVTDDALMGEAKTIFADAGVPADKAQGLINLFGKAMKAATDAQAAAHNTQQQTWVSEINAMPEFTGPTRETSRTSLARLWDEFGTPEAAAIVDSTGAGNNPAFVKMMLKLANTVLEGTPAAAGRPTGESGARRGQPKTVGEALGYKN